MPVVLWLSLEPCTQAAEVLHKPVTATEEAVPRRQKRWPLLFKQKMPKAEHFVLPEMTPEIKD